MQLNLDSIFQTIHDLFSACKPMNESLSSLPDYYQNVTTFFSTDHKTPTPIQRKVNLSQLIFKSLSDNFKKHQYKLKQYLGEVGPAPVPGLKAPELKSGFTSRGL